MNEPDFIQLRPGDVTKLVTERDGAQSESYWLVTEDMAPDYQVMSILHGEVWSPSSRLFPVGSSHNIHASSPFAKAMTLVRLSS